MCPPTATATALLLLRGGHDGLEVNVLALMVLCHMLFRVPPQILHRLALDGHPVGAVDTVAHVVASFLALETTVLLAAISRSPDEHPAWSPLRGLGRS